MKFIRKLVGVDDIKYDIDELSDKIKELDVKLNTIINTINKNANRSKIQTETILAKIHNIPNEVTVKNVLAI